VAASRHDLAILREIVRIVQEKARVPEKVRILKRQYLLTYLEDHRQRLEEALRRFDSDRVNMLFGQLASKVKYQLVRTSRRQAAAKRQVVAKPRRAAKVVVRTAKAATSVKRAVSRKAPAQAKRTPHPPQPSTRPKRAAPQPQHASRSRVAAARKSKTKKRARSR